MPLTLGPILDSAGITAAGYPVVGRGTMHFDG